jgi:hypothetical protein
MVRESVVEQRSLCHGSQEADRERGKYRKGPGQDVPHGHAPQGPSSSQGHASDFVPSPNNATIL